MPTPFERMKAVWDSPDRRAQLNRVVETMAVEGVTRNELDDALGRLLDEVRASGADDETEEIIMAVGDRLHDWCHESGRIAITAAALSTEERTLQTRPAILPPVHPSHG